MKKSFTLAFCFIFLSSFLFAEKYQIGDVTYEIEGKTKEYSLRKKVPVSTEKIFENKEELETYREDILQQLINLRYAKEISVEIDFGDKEETEIENENDDEIKTVTMNIKSSDSHHLLILPYPKYDDNAGFSGKIKMKDTNFFGSLNEMNAEIFVDSEKKDEGRSDDVKSPTIGAKFSYNHPFPLGIFNASWNNEFQFNVNFDGDEPNPFEFAAKTGITLELPITKRISFVQDYSFKASLDNYYAENSIDNDFKFDDAMYYTGCAEFSFPFNIMTIEAVGPFSLVPFIKYEHTFDNNGIAKHNEDLISPFLSAGQKIVLGRINWRGNFRNGIELSEANSFGYNFAMEDGENFITKIEFESKAFKAFKYASLSSDFRFFYVLHGREKIGQRLRGIMDNQFYANSETYSQRTQAAFVLNFDVPVRIVRTNWQKLFKNWNWVKYFDFELQLAPFIDIALTHNLETDRYFNPKDGFYAAGFEVLVYPLHWKSIVVRASLGFDLADSILHDALNQSFRNSISHHEMYIGIGLHY